MTRNEHMVMVIMQVLKSEKLSLESLKEKVPKGFWNKVSEIYPKDLGYPTEKSVLSNYFGKNKERIMLILESVNKPESTHNPDPEQPIPLSDSHSEPALQDSLKPTQKPIQASSYSKEEIYQLIDKVVQERLHELKTLRLNELGIDRNESPEFELVPEPETVKGSIGRKLNRKFVKTTVTVDQILWSLFEQQAKTLKIDKSRLLDSILWIHFDKPRLTYGNE